MSRTGPRLFSIPPGAPFLRILARSIKSGKVVGDFRAGDDPLALAQVTIFVPTRRAARELRGIFVEESDVRSAILPVIRPLGEFDEDGAAFESGSAGDLELAPAISPIDRLLALAPLVRSWKNKLPAHIADRFEEEVVVPASSADALWLARDLGSLIDQVETEGADWSRLKDLVEGDIAGWWQVTLDFLKIVTERWPAYLAEKGRIDPAAARSLLIRQEAQRLKRTPPGGPVIAAGSTGSIPATAELLAVIANLPRGAVVLPGLDLRMDARAWGLLTGEAPSPAVLGHPQFGLAKLLRRLGATRADVKEIGEVARNLVVRNVLVGRAFRPAEATDDWVALRGAMSEREVERALSSVTLIEAPTEREEAAAVAVAIRQAVDDPARSVAVVTGDRNLARRIARELQRFGIRADDSGGTPLAATPPATLLRLMLEAAFGDGDPVPLLALIKHPLLRLGLERATVRHAAETIELVALRGGNGRPTIDGLAALFEARLTKLAADPHRAFWWARLSAERRDSARLVLTALAQAFAPLAALRAAHETTLADALRATVASLELAGRAGDSSLGELYGGEAGARLAEMLRGLVGATAPFGFATREWPDVFAVLIATETVKPKPGGDSRVAIWGALEARLQSVDTLVIAGVNEGIWPRRAEADRFLSRMMKADFELQPPERRIGLAAHDFQMALGAENLVLSRAGRSGDSPAVASRWLQRLQAFAGKVQTDRMRARGQDLIAFARALDDGVEPRFERPQPAPALDARPGRFSVTEIETLRRDPYAIYARKILKLQPLDPLIRDPGAAERGSLFHDILHRFSETCRDPLAADAEETLLRIGRVAFDAALLPAEVDAVWWPRFRAMAGHFVIWEQGRAASVAQRLAEIRAESILVGATSILLGGRADRIDLLHGGMANILDYKTGSTPSKAQAHTLLAPQLALEGALLERGAFKAIGPRTPSQLSYIRLKANGEVFEESILENRNSIKTAGALSAEAWSRLDKLLQFYQDAATKYLSRALPFREGETDGDYDHLARVLEWSAGGDGPADTQVTE